MSSTTKWLKIIIGLFLGIMIAFPLLMGGIAILVVVPIFQDDNGYFLTPKENIDENITAIVFKFNVYNEGANFSKLDDDIPAKRFMKDFDDHDVVTFKVKAHQLDAGKGDIFIGIMEANEAENYLGNISYGEITEFDLSEGINVTTHNDGVATEPMAPNTQTWVKSNTGTDEILTWSPTSGSFWVVIMNSDGTKGLNVNINIGVRISIIQPIGVGLTVFGILFSFVAIILIILGIQTSTVPQGKPRVRYYRAVPSTIETGQPPTPSTKSVLVCGYCGVKNLPDSRFCAECGEPLFVKGVTTTQTADKQAIESDQTTVPPSDELIIATWGARIVAFLIDFVIVSLILEVIKAPLYFIEWVNFNLFFSFTSGISLLILTIYFIIMEHYFGQTVGKRLMNIETVSSVTGEKPTEIKDIAIDSIGKGLFIIFDLILGAIVHDDKKSVDLRQRFSQTMANTVVVYKRQVEQPSQVKFRSDSY